MANYHGSFISKNLKLNVSTKFSFSNMSPTPEQVVTVNYSCNYTEASSALNSITDHPYTAGRANLLSTCLRAFRHQLLDYLWEHFEPAHISAFTLKRLSPL